MKLRYASGGILVAALLVLPTSAAARQGSQVDTLSAQQCAQERSAVGKKSFRKRYGAKHTMRTCVRRHRAQVAGAVQVATQDCQDELATEDPATFIDDYGQDPTDSLDNAMTECVAEGADAILNPDTGNDTSDDGTDV